MKKLSQINELFSASMKRNIEGTSRKEDNFKFINEFNSMKSSEFVDLGLPSKNLWCSCNFGTDVVGGAGLFMNQSDIKLLSEYLEGTEYKIADFEDYKELGLVSYKYRKDNYWNLIFDEKLVIPQCSFKKILKPKKGESFYFGYDGGYIKGIEDDVTNSIFFFRHIDTNSNLQVKLQVRIIKKS